MSEKRLFQCDWNRGQTDGDPKPGTVRRILNMEMIEPGVMTTRKAFAGHTISIGNCAAMVKMDFSPEWSNADAWLFGIHANSIIAIPLIGAGYGAVEYITIPDLSPGGMIDLEKSQLTISGDKIVALIVKQGETDGDVFIVQSLPSMERFRAPYPHRGTTIDPSYSSETNGWSIYRARAVSPSLFSETVQAYGFLDTNHAGESRILPWTGKANEYHWPANKVDISGNYYSALSNMANLIQNQGPLAVGLVLVVASPDDDLDGKHIEFDLPPTSIYGRTAIIEYKVQYLYYGGQMSELSNGVRVNDWDDFQITNTDDEVFRYAVGVGLILPVAIGREVKGINIYRQNIETGNPDEDSETEPQLIATHWIDSEVLEDAEVNVGDFDLDIGSDEEYMQALRYGYNYQPNSMDLAKPYAAWKWTRYSMQPESWAFWPEQNPRRVMSSVGSCMRTSGWVKVSSGSVMYMDTHYGANCLLKLKLYGWYGHVIETSVNTFLASRYSGVSGKTNALIRFGCSMPLTGMREIANPNVKKFICFGRPLGPVTLVEQSFTSIGSGMPLDGIAAFKTFGTVVVTTSGMQTGFEKFGAGPIAEDKIPFVGYRDTGGTPLDSESSFIGATSESLVTAKPAAIAISAGRLLGAGGRFDNQRAPTRVWYSLFQNFGFVTDSAFLDYGARDDGYVVGISSYKSRIILHFSSATYIIDASGGSDMTWRELGAINNVGLVNRNAVIETPVGNIWADKDGVHLFNGRGITEITHMPEAGISVRSTYKAMIAGNHSRVRVSYKSTRQQVWISVYNRALVWDLETGAWHERVVDEITANSEIIGFAEFGGVENLIALWFGNSVRLHPETDSEDLITFEWGMDIMFDSGAVEVVKKTKRFYVDAFADSSGRRMEVAVNSQGGPEAVQILAVPHTQNVDNVTVFSSSTRGRKIEISLRNEGTGWGATINGLGMSHKLKPLK